MAKEDTRTRIIRHGARLIHTKGYNATGLADILKAAGVPKGSFYFYFQNKEAFGLAVIDHYAQGLADMALPYLNDAARPPLERLAAFMDGFAALLEDMGHACGCPIGNLMQEMSDSSPAFRDRVGTVYAQMTQLIAQCLTQAKAQDHLPQGLDPAQAAQFILNSWEGAIMHMKLVKNSDPLILCKRMVFDRILK